MPPARYARARARRRLYWAIAGVACAAIVAIVLALSLGGGGLAGAPAARDAPETGAQGLFHYDPAHAAQYIARATAGNAQVLFAKSPDGAIATARRVAALRPLIDRAVAGTDVPANTLEGLVFLESAGIVDAAVGGDAANAAGLTQILPSTATSLLHMHVDVTAAKRLLAQIPRSRTPAQQRRLQRRLEAADERFDPVQALRGAVRLLVSFEGMLGGRLDLAVTAYHMGIGNMQDVLADYDGGRAVPYVQLYFDTAPDHHASAYRLLSTLGDDSSLYWWRVLGAEQIMHLYRTDRGALDRLQSLETADDAGGSVLHPPGRSPRYASATALQRAYTSHALQPLPRNAAALGLAYDASIGAESGAAPRSLYVGLSPSAVRLLIRMAAAVRTLSGGVAPLHVAAAVADGKYLSSHGESDPLAQTGFSFRIARRYRSDAQAAAFQAVLDRLQSLNLIAWARLGSVIQITAASDAGSWQG
ncbi:MAG TPA: transglycosylase SLT domain-containing protein [Solirubrobacteraceae bacterium]|nr:transglycosylase SLT domain-containing protein [Solirubrobacteraceae bacterium]